MKLIRITPRLIFGILLSIISSLLGLIIPLIVRRFINLKHFSFSSIPQKLLILGGIIILVDTLASTFSGYLISSEGDRQVKQIRLTLQKKIFTLPQSYFDQQISGNLTSRIINDVGILRSFLTTTIPSTVTGLITIVGAVVTMMALDWKLTVLMVLMFPADAIITIPLGHINERIAEQAQGSLGELTGVTSESLKNIRTVKLNNAEKPILSRISASIAKLFNLSIKTDRIAAATGPLQSMISLILVLIVVLYGASRVKSGDLSTGTLGAFMMYFFQIITPVNDVAMFYTDQRQMVGATKKIKEIMTESPEELEKLPQQKADYNTYELVLKDVSFSYDEEPVLENINLQVQTGEKIALVGSTGAGKSTLINLITRLYPINSGEILLNNLSAYDFNLKQWRSFFSVVAQENTILSGTVRENLTLGLSKKISDEDLWHALSVAKLDKIVSDLPDKLDSTVGEQGTRLSGGQRQRLQIARAYLRDCKFLILDEATSSLDSDTEKNITEGLDKLVDLKNCGMITIAHRLSTIANSDTIYFLKDKHIVAHGTHSELLEEVPEYRRYVREQQLKEEVRS